MRHRVALGLLSIALLGLAAGCARYGTVGGSGSSGTTSTMIRERPSWRPLQGADPEFTRVPRDVK